MRDLQDIIEAFHRARKAGTDCVLATVVHVEGSTYRRVGARALFLSTAHRDAGMTIVGLVSGGCLERDLALRAEDILKSGLPTRVRYDSLSDDDLVFGLGLGCRGVVEILLERVGKDGSGPLDWIARCIEQRESGVIATVVRGDTEETLPLASRWLFNACGRSVEPGMRPEWDAQVADVARRLLASSNPANQTRTQTEAQTLLKSGTVISIERVPRQIQLLIVGAGADTPMLVDLASNLGWHVVVVDPRPAFAQSPLLIGANRIVGREPGENCGLALDRDTVAVIMSHNYGRDLEALRWLLPSPIRYLGVLGPRTRTDRLLADLAGDGVRPSVEQTTRLAAPAGLDIGGDGPHAIAIAIAAEIQAVLAGRKGGRLRNRGTSIHEPVE